MPELDPVTADVCCFGAAGVDDDQRAAAVNSAIVQRRQLSGDAVFSTTRVGTRAVIRAAITNQRTRQTDVEHAPAAAISTLRGS